MKPLSCEVPGKTSFSFLHYPSIEGLLLPTGIEPTPFLKSASKVAGLHRYMSYVIKAGINYCSKFMFIMWHMRLE